MKQLKLAWVIAALAALGTGCAHIVEMRVPREFKGKKQIEDPPVSLAPSQAQEVRA